jgi:hypothetical protein
VGDPESPSCLHPWISADETEKMPLVFCIVRGNVWLFLRISIALETVVVANAFDRIMVAIRSIVFLRRGVSVVAGLIHKGSDETKILSTFLYYGWNKNCWNTVTSVSFFIYWPSVILRCSLVFLGMHRDHQYIM